uniref:Uncharacterized protein n=1 Tax=Tetranychus urticae TaxID=32264 RepID=T1JRW8_TETUR
MSRLMLLDLQPLTGITNIIISTNCNADSSN